jgi:hypothetical protein
MSIQNKYVALYDSIFTQGVPTLNDYISAEFIISELEKKMATNFKDSFEYYSFNLSRAVTYSSDIIFKQLLEHKMFKYLKMYSPNTFDALIELSLKTSNLRIIECLYSHVKFLEGVIEKRLDFIEKNEKLSSLLKTKPFIGIFYDINNKFIVDRLTSIEDIIDDYTFFETYTGITLDDPNFLDKIKVFLGDSMEFSDIHYFLELRDSTN